MSKAVLISIRPKWCEKIAGGEKTVEIRKTRPKMEPPFRCYIYCTLPKYPHEDYITTEHPLPQYYGGGKVIGEFVCDRIFPIDVYDNGCIKDWNFECMWQACLPYEGIAAYIGREKRGYGWHISNLKIYDTPKELGEFKGLCKVDADCCACPYYNYTKMDCDGRKIKRTFQSWGYVEEVE